MIRWSIPALAAAALVGMQNAGATQTASTTATEVPMPTGDAENGFALYAEGCRACHSGLIAPTLKGIVGRPIAGVAGYDYGTGLKGRSAETWTTGNLYTFLASPQGFAACSTKMKTSLPGPQERADVIAFLETFTD